MRPKYATTYRPHGKWGDFFACVIPVSWCVNILINSNFILRLIEWQNESSLFTVRVRGKQWYWVYKFELKNFTDILSAPKNIGTNKWVINVFGDLQTAEDYHHILQMRAQNKWVKTYWNETLQQSGVSSNKNHIILPQEQLKLDLVTSANTVNLNNIYSTLLFKSNTAYFVNEPTNSTTFLNNFFLEKSIWQQYDADYADYQSYIVDDSVDNSNENESVYNDTELCELYCSEFVENSRKDFVIHNLNFLNFLTYHENTDLSNLAADFNEFSTTARRSNGSILPVRLIKNPLIADNFQNEQTELFRLRFNDESNAVQHKVLPHTTYLTIKQKRYKRKKVIASSKKFLHTEQGGKTKIVKATYKPLLVNNSVFDDITSNESNFNATRQYRMLKKNKQRSEVFSIVTNRRMIRTKRTLVLPAHVNITIISNSYDVVHAWWIPGLGIKIDCVPGRSTHHTFFVDNIGFYYGQCAEICGRYHHHMPIRLCALPFEHFLVWWYSFGLPKMLFTKQKRRLESTYGFTKYTW